MNARTRTLLIEHLPRLQAYALSLTRNRAHADDLLQTTAEKTLRSEHQFTPGTNFAAWTTRIMRNAFLDQVRRAQTASVDDAPGDDVAAPPVQEIKVLERELLCAFSTIPRDQAAALQAIGFDGLTYAEVSRTTGCGIGTLKTRVFRARRQLRSTLSDTFSSQGAGFIS